MIDFLLQHAAKNTVSFHMPGHKGREIFEKYGFEEYLKNWVDCDITEIPGADNLFAAEGILRDVADAYATLYDVKKSYLLINGTSGGLISAMLASVPRGGKIIMAGNCHKSVFNGLILGEIQPVYAYPEVSEIAAGDISGPISAEEIERCHVEHPDASAVILPSPNYYGVCSDISSIADVVHKAGKILIVDQAHGAHLHFFNKFGIDASLPKSAEFCGADIVVNSTHKTLATLTQSSLLNVSGDRVLLPRIEDALQMMESTSPSYVLMASLAMNAKLLAEHGAEAFADWKAALDLFYQNASSVPGLSWIGKETPGMDVTKINLSMRECGLTGKMLEEELRRRGVIAELSSGDLVMLMSGIGTTAEDMEKLLAALKDIAATCEAAPEKTGKKRKTLQAIHAEEREPVLWPLPAEREYVPLSEAAGRICASSLTPYPPGIPVCCPGERISEAAVAYCIEKRKDREVIAGLTDSEEVCVCKE